MRLAALFRTLMLTLGALTVLWGCSASDVATEASSLGKTSSMAELRATLNAPGPISFQKHTVARWQTPLSGIINLDHPKAIAAGLEDHPEIVYLFVYTIKHPKHGTYIVDSGVSERFVDPDNNADVSFAIKHFMNIPAIETLLTTKQLIQDYDGIDGVFLTHIHLDHIMGLTDVSKDVPVYVGAGDVDSQMLLHLATRGTTNRLLAGTPLLKEWRFDEGGIVDVFGDGSFWAISVPGHSPGSVAYLARTTSGPQLMIGDTTHTRWGWDNQVEPGSYTKDNSLNVASLQMLSSLAKKHPAITVHPGHQE